ncbi:MAG: flagellar biosynthesis regulator FlaF [Magnetospirillum sp. WYHS-4]
MVKNYATPPTAGNPREVEAWALTQAALRMKDAQDSKDRDAMLAAVRLNWRLWTIIQADLLDPDCPLPTDLRVNGLSLASFVDKHTLEFLTNPLPQNLSILISINREIAGGLYQRPAATGSEAGQAAPAPGASSGTNTTV